MEVVANFYKKTNTFIPVDRLDTALTGLAAGLALFLPYVSLGIVAVEAVLLYRKGLKNNDPGNSVKVMESHN